MSELKAQKEFVGNAVGNAGQGLTLSIRTANSQSDPNSAVEQKREKPSAFQEANLSSSRDK
jgi:hypothetical protein